MKNKTSNRAVKKGFTIVELVIVVAIIAILAAVLIPTFASVIKRANLSNDQSLIRNMNTVLATEVIPETKFNYAGNAVAALNENGFADKYTPFTTGYHYGYHIESNKMYLIDENNTPVYPDTSVSLSDLWIIWGNNAIDKVIGAVKYVSLVNIDSTGYYSSHFGDSANYTLDLAGHFINVSGTLSNVTAVNGVLISGAASGSGIITTTAAAESDITADATIENKVFNYTDSLRNKVESTANVTYKNCYFYSWKGNDYSVIKYSLTFDGCAFIDSAGYVFNVQGSQPANTYSGTFTVKNCTFTNCKRIFNLPLFVLGEENPGSIIITGNTFGSVTAKNRPVIQLQHQVVSGTNSAERGYINITISNNNFTGIASTQAGLITLRSGKGDSGGTDLIEMEGLSTDHITFSENTVSSSIPTDKYIVNDGGEPDSAFPNYKAQAFKAALTNKFISGKK